MVTTAGFTLAYTLGTVNLYNQNGYYCWCYKLPDFDKLFNAIMPKLVAE